MKIKLLLILLFIFSLLAVDKVTAEREEVTSYRIDIGSIMEGGKGEYNAESILSADQIESVERKLTELRYNQGKIDGKADNLFECAVIAFQKMNGLERNGLIDAQFKEALKNPLLLRPHEEHQGIHTEADLERQIMTVYKDRSIHRILPISSGSNKAFTEHGEGLQFVKTPLGDFVFLDDIRGSHRSHLGELFNPVYFHRGGYAVHGDLNVPPYGASHVCLRITINDSEWFIKNVPIGSPLLISENKLSAVRKE